MAYFAEIEQDGTVKRVIVADQEFINSGLVGDPANWIETSLETYGGKHSKGGNPLRKNYAGPGYKYDQNRNAFIPPKAHPNWILDEETCLWKDPNPNPESNRKNNGRNI